MLTLTLTRLLTDVQGTVGVLNHGSDIVCMMAELPWRENRRNMSCIPAGHYSVVYANHSASGRFSDIYVVLGVQDRTGILIHAGNHTGDRAVGLKSDSHGCLHPGFRIGRIGGQRAILDSADAMERLHALTGRAGFKLDVVETYY